MTRNRGVLAVASAAVMVLGGGVAVLAAQPAAMAARACKCGTNVTGTCMECGPRYDGPVGKDPVVDIYGAHGRLEHVYSCKTLRRPHGRYSFTRCTSVPVIKGR